jgi:hypothetical protein
MTLSWVFLKKKLCNVMISFVCYFTFNIPTSEFPFFNFNLNPKFDAGSVNHTKNLKILLFYQKCATLSVIQFRLRKKRTRKMSAQSERCFIRPRLMKSFNLIQALMSFAFLITLCLYTCLFNNFDACKFVCIKYKCVGKYL